MQLCGGNVSVAHGEDRRLRCYCSYLVNVRVRVLGAEFLAGSWVCGMWRGLGLGLRRDDYSCVIDSLTNIALRLISS